MNAKIDVTVIRVPGLKSQGDNHQKMDSVAIHAPLEVEGLKISGMEISRGEVEEFYIPLAFTTISGRASTSLSGYEEAIKNFEILIRYENYACKRIIQKLL